tara:strand:- start:564 stop:2468 length:1905 start_codon:yes stop_codon:yes gene_type:complete
LIKGFEINQDRKETTEAGDAVVAFEREKNDLFFNQDNGYYATQGKTAYDGYGDAEGKYQKLYDKHYNELSSGAKDKAKNAFNTHYTNDSTKMAQHSAAGFSAYEDDMSKSAIENSVELSGFNYNDRTITDQQMRSGMTTVTQMAKKAGVDSEERVQNYVMTNVTGMVGAALEHDDIDGANDVLDAYGDMLGVEGGEQGLRNKIKDKVEQLKAKSDAVDNVTTARGIFAATGGNLSLANKALANIPADQVKGVRAEFNAMVTMENAAKTERNEQTMQDYYRKDPTSSRAVWKAENQGAYNELTLSQKEAIDKNVPRKTDPTVAIMLGQARSIQDETERKKAISELTSQFGDSMSESDLVTATVEASSDDKFAGLNLGRPDIKAATVDMDKEDAANFGNIMAQWYKDSYDQGEKKAPTDEEIRKQIMYLLDDSDRYKNEGTGNTDPQVNEMMKFKSSNTAVDEFKPVTPEHVASIETYIERFKEVNKRYPDARDIKQEKARQMKSIGMVTDMNIDLNNRKPIRNEDGTISTVKSITVTVDDKFALIPTVWSDGKTSKYMTEEAAIKYFQLSGEHLGIYESSEQADASAEKISKMMGDIYAKDAERSLKAYNDRIKAKAGQLDSPESLQAYADRARQ